MSAFGEIHTSFLCYGGGGGGKLAFSSFDRIFCFLSTVFSEYLLVESSMGSSFNNFVE